MEQQFGAAAIGTFVARDFGEAGIFNGQITAFNAGECVEEELYSVEYEGGDKEDLDREEYNYAYALYLQEGGWTLEDVDGHTEGEGDFGRDHANWVPSKVISDMFEYCFCFRENL